MSVASEASQVNLDFLINDLGLKQVSNTALVPAAFLTEFASIWGDGSVAEASPRALDQLLCGRFGRRERDRGDFGGFCARVACVVVVDVGRGPLGCLVGASRGRVKEQASGARGPAARRCPSRA